MIPLRVRSLLLRWQYLPWKQRCKAAAVCGMGGVLAALFIVSGRQQGLTESSLEAPPHAFLQEGMARPPSDLTMALRRRAALLAPLTYPQLYPSCSKLELPPPTSGRAEVLELQRSQAGEDLLLYDQLFTSTKDSGHGHDQEVEEDGGVFLEIGALDGEKWSNTYLFEKALGWRGILVEAHPGNAAALMSADRPRSARFAGVACCQAEGWDEKPGSLVFSEGGGEVATARDVSTRRFQEEWAGQLGRGNVSVPCLPLQHLIDATGLWDIDLFSLDVEGSEWAVLQTVDLGVTNVRVFLVEMDGYDEAKDEAVRAHLRAHGFQPWPHDQLRRGWPRSEVFVNPRFHAVKRARPPLPLPCAAA